MDRRSLKRRHLIYYLRVFQVDDGKLLGHLVDITKKGIMLVGETALSVNTDYDMKMLLPFPINGKKELLLKGRCIYSKPDVNPTFFSSGFELTDTSDDVVAETIDRLIKHYGFHD